MQLTIKNKKRDLSWGMGALENLCDELAISLSDIDMAIMNNETATLNRLVYCALKNGAEIEGDELDFNYKYFLDWLDKQSEGTGAKIMDDFLASKLLGKTMKARYEEIIDRLKATEIEGATPPKKKSTRSEKL